MLNWDDAILQCQDLASDYIATSLTFFKRNMNLGYKFVLADLGRSVGEKRYTASTVASRQYYQLPSDYLFLKAATITVGGQVHPVFEEESQEMWDLANVVVQTSDIPDKYFLRPGFGIAGVEIGFAPRPSTAGNTITVTYEATDKDLSIDAYVAGTIAVTSGSADVVGTATTFTAAMVGRYLKLDSGDGLWYKVQSFTSVTAITLENVYEGSTLTGQTYKIAEIFALPEEMQMLPVYYALWFYFMGPKKDKEQAATYRALFVDELEKGRGRHATKSRSNIIRGRRFSNRFPRATPAYFPSTVS